MAKATELRGCVVDFNYIYTGFSLVKYQSKEKVIIDLDKLKIIKAESYRDFTEEQEAAQKILKKWKRSKEVTRNKAGKTWFTAAGNLITIDDVCRWFTKCEAK